MMIFRILIFLTLAMGLYAQEPQRSPDSGPLTIWDYQKVLGLTNPQVREMKGIMGSFQERMKTWKVEIRTSEARLNEMIQREAPMQLIRKVLEEIARIQVEMRYADVLTSRRFNKVMLPDQVEKWHEIQRIARTSP